MLAPAIEYKDELLQLFQAQTNKVKWLTSIPSTITDLIYNTDISFSFVSINENNKVIGYFHYCFVPINENETAATNVKILNFFGGEI